MVQVFYVPAVFLWLRQSSVTVSKQWHTESCILVNGCVTGVMTDRQMSHLPLPQEIIQAWLTRNRKSSFVRFTLKELICCSHLWCNVCLINWLDLMDQCESPKSEMNFLTVFFKCLITCVTPTLTLISSHYDWLLSFLWINLSVIYFNHWLID